MLCSWRVALSNPNGAGVRLERERWTKRVGVVLAAVSGLLFVCSFWLPFVCSDFSLREMRYIGTVQTTMGDPCTQMLDGFPEMSVLGTFKAGLEEACAIAVEPV